MSAKCQKRTYLGTINPNSGVNPMADKTPKKSAKVAKKATARRVVTKAIKSRKTAPKLQRIKELGDWRGDARSGPRARPRG